jgi:predicted metalloprotease with PDZ domain
MSDSIQPTDVQGEFRAQDSIRAAVSLERRNRLFEVATRIRVAGVELCGDRIGSWIGIMALPDSASPQWARVWSVAHGSPAHEAGVRPGDLVIDVDRRSPKPVEDLDIFRTASVPSLSIRSSGAGARRVSLR